MSLSLSGIAQVPCEGVEVLNFDIPKVCHGRDDPNLGKIADLRDTIPNMILRKFDTFLL